jgi:hypothetical protein
MGQFHGKRITVLDKIADLIILTAMKYLLLLLLLTTAVTATEYQRFIVSIAEDGSQIKLDDGFIWVVRTHGRFFSRPWRERVRDSWLPGDEVTLETDFDKDASSQFFLKNGRLKQYIGVDYNQQPEDWLSLTIVDINPKGNLITLSDGSHWVVINYLLWPRSRYWKVGEMLHICQEKPSHYQLLNPKFGLQTTFWRSPLWYKKHSCVRVSF